MEKISRYNPVTKQKITEENRQILSRVTKQTCIDIHVNADNT